MDEILKFVDQFTLDDQLYWRIPQLYTNKEFEVQWVKDEKPNWRFRMVDGLFWKKATSKDIIAALNEDKLDLVQFEQNVRSGILHQVIFADMLLNKATDLLGKETIERALEDNKKFIQSIIAAISELTKEPAPGEKAAEPMLIESEDIKPRLRMVKE